MESTLGGAYKKERKKNRRCMVNRGNVDNEIEYQHFFSIQVIVRWAEVLSTCADAVYQRRTFALDSARSGT